MTLLNGGIVNGHADNAQGSRDRIARIDRVLETAIRCRDAGEPVSSADLAREHSDLEPELSERLRELERVELVAVRAQASSGGAPACDEAGGSTPAWLSAALPAYQIHHRLYRGGQSLVYRATQIATGREVAIKLMRESPFLGPRERGRFEREVKVLGRLRHPNIVTIHDSGVAQGCPYFVMDYIPGAPLDDYVRSNDLCIRSILQLFAKICRAVHAAHLLGVIHRDLKPSNIRIDDRGEPHVLDFGLAKLAEDVGTERQVTMTGQFIGSINWSSPEQALGSPDHIDLRTDIYSLGVIAFQMLTGRFPYDVSGNVRDVLDRIQEDDPIRPGTIRSQIDSDVDCIVSKCLEKEPERRYQSALAVAEDVERYLDGQPILARAPSTVYQLKKLIRRHKWPFVSITVIVLVSIISAVAMGVLYRAADVERNRAVAAETLAGDRQLQAEAAADAARFTREFLIADVIGLDVWAADNRDSTVEEALARAAKRLKASPPEDLRTRAELNFTIGAAQLARGLLNEACDHLQEAIDTCARLEHCDELLIRARLSLAEALSRKTDLREAADLASGTWQEAMEFFGENHPLAVEALKVSADLRWRFRQDEQAAAMAERAAARCSETLGHEHLTSLSARMLLAAQVRPWQGRASEGMQMLRSLLETYRRTRGEESPEALSTEGHLGPILRDQGYLAEAEPLLVGAHERFARVFGMDSGEAIGAAIQLGILRRQQNRLTEAADILERAAAAAQLRFGVDHSHYQSSIQYLASVYGRQGFICKAGPMIEQLVESRRGTAGRDHVGTCMSGVELAATYYTVGRFAEAEPLARHAIQPFEAHDSATGVNTVWAKLTLTRILVALNRVDEAQGLAEEVLAARKQQAERADATLQDILYCARELLTIEPQTLRDPELAMELLESIQCTSPTDCARVDHYVAIASARRGDYQRAITLMANVLHVTPWEHSQVRDEREDLLVNWFRATGDADSALEVLATTHAYRERAFSSMHHDTLHAKLRLADALFDANRFDELDALIEDCRDFQNRANSCMIWPAAKCRFLKAAKSRGDGHTSAEFLPAYQDMIADPWIPEKERMKASHRVLKWISAILSY